MPLRLHQNALTGHCSHTPRARYAQGQMSTDSDQSAFASNFIRGDGADPNAGHLRSFDDACSLGYSTSRPE
jgi:hypothetical protein